jgi:hypothetical protein
MHQNRLSGGRTRFRRGPYVETDQSHLATFLERCATFLAEGVEAAERGTALGISSAHQRLSARHCPVSLMGSSIRERSSSPRW